jgi:hypothetical protein
MDDPKYQDHATIKPVEEKMLGEARNVSAPQITKFTGLEMAARSCVGSMERSHDGWRNRIFPTLRESFARLGRVPVGLFYDID